MLTVTTVMSDGFDSDFKQNIVTISSKHLDPYQKALQSNLGDKIAEHERLKTVLKRLNPNDYLDWDESAFHRKFDDSRSSYS